MRVPFAFNRLRTVIMTSLALLILSAMLLTHVVTAKLTERDLINARIESGRLLLEAVGIFLSEQPLHQGADLKEKRWDLAFGRHLVSLLQTGGFSGIQIRDDMGRTVVSQGHWDSGFVFRNTAMLQSPRTARVEFSGTTWGLFWQAPETVILSSSLRVKGRFAGSVAVFSDLKPLYRKMRSSEPVILAYIGLNALILVIFGIYLLSRTVVRPINRLVSVTERFNGKIPFVEKEESPNDEIGRLSKSLNRMLRQLDANERKLKENISSLEAANEEIRRAQDEMVATEKMASVGRLATGVAHEIGNPLGILLGYMELLRRGDLAESERKDFLSRMESEITRIHRIIRDLLDFSRPSTAEGQNADAHEVLEEVLSVISPQPLFETVHIRRLLHAKHVMVKVGQDSLKQVFLNIIMNAADAMTDEKGMAEIPQEPTLTIESFNESGLLIMRFSDMGSGIRPDDMNRIFDPFFSTKAPGKGTGLGLSICYTIMERAGGRIRAESEPGKGTTVTLEMPLGKIANEEIYGADKMRIDH